MNRIRKMLRLMAALTLTLCVVASCTACSLDDLIFWDDEQAGTESTKEPGAGMVDSSVEEPSTYDEQIASDYTTFAVLGVDARDNTSLYSGVNTDVIMIVSINNSTKDVKMVSVYRDTILQMPDGTYKQINQAQAKWNATETINCLNKNLDLYITDYVIVNWASVATVVNLLGGVEVDVPESMMPYINGYLTETVNSTGIGSLPIASSGYQLLDGPQTVAYCRIRAIDSDFGRTERQRDVVKKILDKAKAAGASTDLEIIAAMLNESQTSFSWSDIVSMCTDIGSYNLSDTAGFPYETYNVEYCAGTPDLTWPTFAADLSANVTTLHTQLYGADCGYTPSQTLTDISAYLEAARLQQ